MANGDSKNLASTIISIIMSQCQGYSELHDEESMSTSSKRNLYAMNLKQNEKFQSWYTITQGTGLILNRTLIFRDSGTHDTNAILITKKRHNNIVFLSRTPNVEMNSRHEK